MDKNTIKLPSFSRIDIFRKCVLKWASKNMRDFPWRKPAYSNYKIVITEIILQRTKVETVANFITKFFKLYPSWKALSRATVKELETSLKPIGLSLRRSIVLSKLSQEMVRHGGRVPCRREEIDLLTGIGQYIGNAIELLCCDKNMPLLDSNMARVLERYFGPRKLKDIRYDPYIQELAKIVVDCEESIKLNFAILDFSHLVCTSRNPKCNQCVLRTNCLYFKRE